MCGVYKFVFFILLTQKQKKKSLHHSNEMVWNSNSVM